MLCLELLLITAWEHVTFDYALLFVSPAQQPVSYTTNTSPTGCWSLTWSYPYISIFSPFLWLRHVPELASFCNMPVQRVKSAEKKTIRKAISFLIGLAPCYQDQMWWRIWNSKKYRTCPSLHQRKLTYQLPNWILTYLFSNTWIKMLQRIVAFQLGKYFLSFSLDNCVQYTSHVIGLQSHKQPAQGHCIILALKIVSLSVFVFVIPSLIHSFHYLYADKWQWILSFTDTKSIKGFFQQNQSIVQKPHLNSWNMSEGTRTHELTLSLRQVLFNHLQGKILGLHLPAKSIS